MSRASTAMAFINWRATSEIGCLPGRFSSVCSRSCRGLWRLGRVVAPVFFCRRCGPLRHQRRRAFRPHASPSSASPSSSPLVSTAPGGRGASCHFAVALHRHWLGGHGKAQPTRPFAAGYSCLHWRRAEAVAAPSCQAPVTQQHPPLWGTQVSQARLDASYVDAFGGLQHLLLSSPPEMPMGQCFSPSAEMPSYAAATRMSASFPLFSMCVAGGVRRQCGHAASRSPPRRTLVRLSPTSVGVCGRSCGHRRE